MAQNKQEVFSQNFFFKEAEEAPDDELILKGIYFDPMEKSNRAHKESVVQVVQKKNEGVSSLSWKEKIKKAYDKKGKREDNEYSLLPMNYLDENEEFQMKRNEFNEETINNEDITPLQKEKKSSQSSNDKVLNNEDNIEKGQDNISRNKQISNNKEFRIENDQEQDSLENPLPVIIPKATSSTQKQSVDFKNIQNSTTKQTNNVNQTSNSKNEQSLIQSQSVQKNNKSTTFKIGSTCVVSSNTHKRNKKRKRLPYKEIENPLTNGIPKRSVPPFQGQLKQGSQSEDEINDDVEEGDILSQISIFPSAGQHQQGKGNYQDKIIDQPSSKQRMSQQSSQVMFNNQMNNKGSISKQITSYLMNDSSNSSDNSEIEECIPKQIQKLNTNHPSFLNNSRCLSIEKVDKLFIEGKNSSSNAGKKEDTLLKSKLINKLDIVDSEIIVKMEQVHIIPLMTFLGVVLKVDFMNSNLSHVQLKPNSLVQGLIKQRIQNLPLSADKVYRIKFKTATKVDNIYVLNVEEYSEIS